MQKTMQNLITATEKRLYQLAGPAVQVYAQDVIMQKLQDAFDHLFTTKFWPQFVVREVKTINGIDGKVTVPFSLITEPKDIHSIFRRSSEHPIPRLPNSINTLDIPETAIAKFWQPRTDNYLFTIYPLDATDQIVVIGRQKPKATDFILTDVVPFDHLALEYWAAWDYCVDDASNAGAAAKFQALFNSRIKELEDAEFDNIVLINPHTSQVPTRWY